MTYAASRRLCVLDATPDGPRLAYVGTSGAGASSSMEDSAESLDVGVYRK